MIKLGVNIDHIATLRNARGERTPDPIWAVSIVERAGADSIVAHLREDRRHIQERDIKLIKEVCSTSLNLEMSAAEEIVNIALQIQPSQVTIVPEKREEITTEGGLDLKKDYERMYEITEKMHEKGIRVSLFLDPSTEIIEIAAKLNVDYIELHTGAYARAYDTPKEDEEFQRLVSASDYITTLKIGLNAGHGLDYRNVKRITTIPYLNELNIGFSIISEAIFSGLESAVTKMKNIISVI